MAARAQEELLWCGKPYDTWPPPTALEARGGGRGAAGAGRVGREARAGREVRAGRWNGGVFLPELRPYTDERIGRVWTTWPVEATAATLRWCVRRAGREARGEGQQEG